MNHGKPAARAGRNGARRRERTGGTIEGCPATFAQVAEDEQQVTGRRGHPRISAESDRCLNDRCERDVQRATGAPLKSISETGAVAAGELSSAGRDAGAAPG